MGELTVVKVKLVDIIGVKVKVDFTGVNEKLIEFIVVKVELLELTAVKIKFTILKL